MIQPSVPSRATERWTILGASVAGVKHLRSGQVCQDAYWHGVLPTGEALLIVSDGAGSASRAEEGSQLAVLAAASFLVTELMTQVPLNQAAWREVVARAFHAVERAICAQSTATKIARREYSATLVLLILADEWTACGLVGDCAAVVRRTDGTLVSLCAPQRGEYANTTNFATHPAAHQWLDIAVLAEPVDCAAVLSDGLLELAMNVGHNRPFAPFFNPLFSFATVVAGADDAAPEIDAEEAERQIEAFLASERVTARTSDDKTLVIAQRQHSEKRSEKPAEQSDAVRKRDEGCA